MTSVDSLVRSFSRYLSASWADVSTLLGHFPAEVRRQLDPVCEWKQASWELLVERHLWPKGVALQVYGDGADLHGMSSRINFPEWKATHKVVLSPRGGARDLLSPSEAVEPSMVYTLDELVCFRSGWYYAEPPFDHVATYAESTPRIFPLDDVAFSLASCAPDE